MKIHSLWVFWVVLILVAIECQCLRDICRDEIQKKEGGGEAGQQRVRKAERGFQQRIDLVALFVPGR